MAVNVTQRDMLLREIIKECRRLEIDVVERFDGGYSYVEGYTDALDKIDSYCYMRLSRKEREILEREEEMEQLKRLEETETL